MKQIKLAAARGFGKHNRATRKAKFLAFNPSLLSAKVWSAFP